ncbi:MAG: hypothetical protein RLZZ337_488 [Bacteroidota bacterium]|jgi:thiol-disulfide isomerase/thioredoxin
MRRTFTIILGIFIFGLFSFTTSINVIKPAVGDKAPEIEMKGANGNILKLSDLRGKVVLIHFWASWCRTCRVENTAYTQAYTSFKNRKFKGGNGFDIYSISLDTDAEVWQKAIKNDRLVWPNHVTDLKKWDSPIVTTYNFKYLPHNLLIDENGTILAKGLFGKALEDFLVSYLAD